MKQWNGYYATTVENRGWVCVIREFNGTPDEATEFLNWFKLHESDGRYFTDLNDAGDGWKYYFEKPEDAIIFALRWA